MFEKWQKRVDDVFARPDIYEFTQKVLDEHYDDIWQDQENYIKEWNVGHPFKSGLFLGQYQKIWVEASEKDPPKPRDDTAPAQFAVGMF